MEMNGIRSQTEIYKSILDLQKDLLNTLIENLPQANLQVSNNNVEESPKTPPPNEKGNVSFYA